MTKDLLNLFVAALYILMIVGTGVFLSWMTIQKRKNKDRMRANFVKKIDIQFHAVRQGYNAHWSWF